MAIERDVRWGIVGPGRIAAKVVEDFAVTPNAVCVAAASRSAERAAAFAAQHGLERSYGSYADIIADPDIDVLYLATPHPQHHAIAMAAIAAAARERGVFVMEAMWTRFQPAIVAARELIADGAIGDVRQVQADLGVNRPYDPTDRLFDPAQGGGAMLDLGVYVVSLAQHFLGNPASVSVSGSLAPTGVDAEAGLLLGYDDGRAAALLISLRGATPGAARLQGTRGWIDIPPRFHHPNSITLNRTGADPEELVRPRTGGGYAHELIEVTEGVRAGRTESRIMPLRDTIAVQRVLNGACEQLGVFHAEDTTAFAS
jgi:predicted dehydrogenase